MQNKIKKLSAVSKAIKNSEKKRSRIKKSMTAMMSEAIKDFFHIS